MSILKMSKSKTWVFTLNNYTDDEIKMLHAWQAEVTRMVVAREVGENGTPHLQGQVTFKRTYRLGAVKKLSSRAHWEIAKAAQDSLYCMKEGSDVIFNVDNRKQGSRTDLKRLRDEILSGETSSKKICLEDDPMVYHQYGRTIEKIEQLKDAKRWRTWETKGIWYWGPTGAGKSVKAMEGYTPETHYIWSNGELLQNYEGQETVIFDEVRARDYPYDFWLKVVNGIPFTVPIKNGKPRQFLAKTVIVTAPMSPQDMYPNQNGKDHIGQLERRFKIERLGPVSPPSPQWTDGLRMRK